MKDPSPDFVEDGSNTKLKAQSSKLKGNSKNQISNFTRRTLFRLCGLGAWRLKLPLSFELCALRFFHRLPASIEQPFSSFAPLSQK